MSTDTLFDMEQVRMDSPRLQALKEHDVQTVHSPHLATEPWLAIPMRLARESLAGYDLTPDESAQVPAMMAGYCRLLDDWGLVFTGNSEREAQDAALSEAIKRQRQAGVAPGPLSSGFPITSDF